MEALLQEPSPMPDPDLFSPLDLVVGKYRSDVHRLSPGATPDALAALEGHLGRALPTQLRTFLSRHDGASMFRGVLRVRATAEMALAREDRSQVVLFADGRGELWAFAADGHGGHVYGKWDGQHLAPHYGTFAAWLAGNLAVADARVKRVEDEQALRLEAVPNDPYQLLLAGEQSLQAGQPEAARGWFDKATRAAPHLTAAWQGLGDALTAFDRQAARQAWMEALRSCTLPLPWPDAPTCAPDVFRSLAGALLDAEAWESELTRFMSERVADIEDQTGAALFEAAALALSHSLVRRGRRTSGREALEQAISSATQFRHRPPLWRVRLESARLAVDLGAHDEAEKQVRQIKRDGPADLHGPATLLVANIAVGRQEPWAEDLLDEAMRCGLDEPHQVHALFLQVERALRMERLDLAQQSLERLEALAGRVALRPALALASLAKGDVARVQGLQRDAFSAYQQGLQHLETRPEPDTTFRLVLRLGDLFLDADQIGEATKHFENAARGFASAELPLREAWTLLRLVRCGAHDTDALLQQAWDTFRDADHAAGMAAVDSLAGDPSRSLDWHLERATVMARTRHDAQRSRPPQERADAERPERRLGAHRFAVSACGPQVVHRLAQELDATSRAISTGRARATDPPVLRYIASLELLSAHRSFDAAEVLLDHLLRREVEGMPWRALQGALARSPNASLVDGLLGVIERPSEHPSPSVSAAAEVLGLRREKAAVGVLSALARPNRNPIVRRAAVVALGRIGDRSVVDRLIEALNEPNLAEPAALALLLLGDRRGVDFHGQALTKGRRDLSHSPGEIVGRYGGPAYLPLLISNATSGTDNRALGALQGLGLLGHPRGVPTLLEVLQSTRAPRVVEVTAGALQILTGHHEDVEEPGGRTRFVRWWEQHEGSYQPHSRYRDGALFSGGALLAKLENANSWVRNTSYEELVITTGATLPFDADGAWRVQQMHLRAWKVWWGEHKERFTPGQWYLDGQPLG